jgi:hypothetical protein
MAGVMQNQATKGWEVKGMSGKLLHLFTERATDETID